MEFLSFFLLLLFLFLFMLCSCYTSIYIEIVGYDQIDGFGKKEVRSFLSLFVSLFLSFFLSFFLCLFLSNNEFNRNRGSF